MTSCSRCSIALLILCLAAVGVSFWNISAHDVGATAGEATFGPKIPSRLITERLEKLFCRNRTGGIKLLRKIVRDERYSTDVRAWCLCRILNDKKRLNDNSDFCLDLRDVVADEAFDMTWLDVAQVYDPLVSMTDAASNRRGVIVVKPNIPFLGRECCVMFSMSSLTPREFTQAVDALRTGVPIDRDLSVSLIHVQHPMFSKVDSGKISE